jgi:uncharacterized protein DUF2568
MNVLRAANLTLRFVLELGALAIAGYWGATIATGTLARTVAAVLLPILIALFWAAFVSPKAWLPTGTLGRAALGLVVFLAAGFLLMDRQHSMLATVYIAFSVVSSLIVYALPQ